MSILKFVKSSIVLGIPRDITFQQNEKHFFFITNVLFKCRDNAILLGLRIVCNHFYFFIGM